MRFLSTTICGGLGLASSALADPPPGNVAQLQQLNRANEAALRQIQRPSGPPWTIQQQSVVQKYLDHRQQADQRWLQERQRRELLLLNQRARTSHRPGLPYSLEGIHLQLRFQQEQQNQLNRFRRQRLSPLR